MTLSIVRVEGILAQRGCFKRTDDSIAAHSAVAVCYNDGVAARRAAEAAVL